MSNHELPEYLSQGEPPRLFSVLSDTSKEKRTMAAFLSCMARVQILAEELLKSANQKIGKRCKIECYVEVVPSILPDDRNLRPDGMIVLRVGKREWKAIFEVKIGKNQLDKSQIEDYRNLARANGIDCLITISNQFTTVPTSHPIESVRKSRSKIPVIHWSWMHVLTTVDLLISAEGNSNKDFIFLLNEFRRFLAHESAGVKGFDQMPREWTELNKFISAGGDISTQPDEAQIILEAWHQEIRDLSLALSRMTATPVTIKLPRKHFLNTELRFQSELTNLCSKRQLAVALDIPGAAAPIDIIVDLARRCIDVGMTLNAPRNKKTTKARVNWLMRQIKTSELDNLHLRITWENSKGFTQHSLVDIVKTKDLIDEFKLNSVPKNFHLFESNCLGIRFTQQRNFIKDLEQLVPDFYDKVGVHLTAWQRPAPKIIEKPSDVTPESISEEADSFAIDT